MKLWRKNCGVRAEAEEYGHVKIDGKNTRHDGYNESRENPKHEKSASCCRVLRIQVVVNATIICLNRLGSAEWIARSISIQYKMCMHTHKHSTTHKHTNFSLLNHMQNSRFFCSSNSFKLKNFAFMKTSISSLVLLKGTCGGTSNVESVCRGLSFRIL